MIVLAQNLVLSDSNPYELTLDHPIVGYKNIVTASNIEADSEADNFPASNLANPATRAKWVSASADEQYVTVTTSSADSIDYVAIARPNFASAQIVVSIEIDSGSGFVEMIAPLRPANDSALLFRFNPQTAIALRIRMQRAGLNIAPQMAVVYVGSLLTLQRKLYQGMASPNHSRTAKVTNAASESGEFLGRIVTQRMLQPKVPLSLIDPDYYRTYIDDFIAASKQAPFFFGWRPQSYPNEIVYASMTNDPSPVPQGTHSLISLSLEMSAVG